MDTVGVRVEVENREREEHGESSEAVRTRNVPGGPERGRVIQFDTPTHA